ncbi:MAG TPA: universal stress protein [Gaiellaceae bacterium]|jgi:APA family basic amino acid/polyamine antiporter|nr:universal stress protein [Gaiellaceae bacterium]
MARKLPGLRRELDARSLFSVAYGEIASSIYFALGIIALHAVGFTPFVLLGVGLLFLLVALSYAEATSALPETGGAATFVRRAYNDLAGFMTGWALFLDYLIVIALSALFVPHYLAGALQISALDRNPWDVIVGVAAIVAVGAIRLVRRPSMYAIGTIVPALDVLTQLVLIAFGFAFLVSPGSVLKGTSLGSAPTVSSLVFAIPLAMLAFTGLETVANLAEEARRPGVDLPRALFLAIGTVVTAYVAIAIVGLSAFPGPQTELGTTWLRSPLVGIADQIRGHTNRTLGDTIRFFVGASGALILLASVTTSISGFCRLAYSLGEHGQLPRAFGRLHRRTLVSPQAIIAVTSISSAIVIASAFLRHDVAFLASVFSFGVLLAFTATQIAVIKLRITEPDLPRPYRTPINITIRGHEIPLPAVFGAILTFAVWVIAIVTHPGARYGGPAWLLVGVIVFVVVRRSHGEGLTERVTAPDTVRFVDVPRFRRVLVPMKLGVIGEEMAATAVKLAAEHRATVEALHVVCVPLDRALDADMAAADARADESLAEATALGAELGVEVKSVTVRGRAIGRAIVDRARDTNADLIVLGSSPRWRRQSRFFSPTVDFVLRQAPCEVLIVAFPQRVLDDEADIG